MPVYNEDGHPIASSRRNKKILQNKGIAESEQPLERQDTVERREYETDQPGETDQAHKNEQAGEIGEMNPVQYLKGRGAQFNPKKTLEQLVNDRNLYRILALVALILASFR